MAFILKDSQQADVSVTVLSRAGNPASVENPRWESDNSDIVAIANDEGTSATIVAAGAVGRATVTFLADGDLGEGVKELRGVLDVEVVGGDAAVVNIVASEPVEKPEPAPAPEPTPEPEPAPPVEEVPPAEAPPVEEGAAVEDSVVTPEEDV